MIVNSWTKVANLVIADIVADRVKVLTVDVFDTLLMRRTDSAFVADYTNRYLAQVLGLSIEEVEMARGRAWNLEVSKAISTGLDCDARILSYFTTWIAYLVGDKLSESRLAELVQEILHAELECEVAALRPNHFMLDVLNTAKKYGIRVVAISDMYLGSGDVDYLLKRHGFDSLIDLVVTSGDVLLQKRTGRLFDHCLKNDGIIFETPADGSIDDVLHVGDDRLADGEMARKAGLRSIVVYDLQREKYRQYQHYSRSTPAPVIASQASGSFTGLDSDAGEVGRTQFGPIYSGFLHALGTAVERDGIHSVWFAAREGWILGEMYEMAQASGMAPRSVPWGYLYISRLASMRSQLTRYGIYEIESVNSNTTTKTYRKLLAPLCLTDADQDSLMQEIGLSVDAGQDDDGVLALLSHERFQGLVSRIGREERQGLRKYLEKTGFPSSGRIAFVDVGWGGQIQRNFCKSLELLGSEVEVVGYYLGTDKRAEQMRREGLMMKALVVDSKRSSGSGMGAFSFVHGIELATRSPHPTVVGYDADSGLPTLASSIGAGRVAESVDDPLLSTLQGGILEFARAYFPLARYGGWEADLALAMAHDAIDVLSLMPSRKHARLITGLNNVANLGMSEGTKLGPQSWSFRPITFASMMKSSLWPGGAVAALFPFVGSVVHLLYRRMSKHLIQTVPAGRNMAKDITLSTERQTPVNKVVKDVLCLDISSIRLASASRYAAPLASKAEVFHSLISTLKLDLIRFVHTPSLHRPSRREYIIHFKSLIRLVYKQPHIFRALKSLTRK